MPWAEKLITSKSNDTQAPEKGRVLSYTDALHEALSIALELDPKVLVLGQGVNDPKGMFGVTTGLLFIRIQEIWDALHKHGMHPSIFEFIIGKLISRIRQYLSKL